MRFKIIFLIFLPCLLQAEIGYVEPWGTDSGLKYAPKNSPHKEHAPLSPAGWAAEQLILFHQHVITHIDGPRSHFDPTSSQYMLLAIRKYGFFKGFVMGCDRLLRENGDPWVYRTREINKKLYKMNYP